MSTGRNQECFWPWATITVLAITAFATAAQFVEPALLPALERTPEALQHNQYWRLLTPLFVHSDGWSQIAFNFPAIALIGYFAERALGARLWLIVYFVSGFLAEIVAYAWQPSGAGASIAGAGLLGALALLILLRARAPQAKFGALLVLVGGLALTGMSNIHGPPILIGGCIILIATRRTAKKDKVPLEK
ncbi:MAG TPA: rhomboid family intramembrane serine protease [Bryobacteraceae bacterium]